MSRETEIAREHEIEGNRLPKNSSPPYRGDSTYDFHRCKLCGAHAAAPAYRLKKGTIHICAACDFHYIDHLDNLPATPAQHDGHLLDQNALHFIEARLPASEIALRKRLALVQSHISLPGARCLDLGAGVGLFTHLLTEAGAVVRGIEPQQIFREYCKRAYGIELHGQTIDADIWQREHAGFFDAVMLWDVFEHVDFPLETLQHVYGVTKSGGWLFLDTPRRDALYYRISEWGYRLSGGANPLFLQSIYSPLPYRHKQIFTRQQLLKLVQDVGYSVVHLNASLMLPQKMVLVCRKP